MPDLDLTVVRAAPGPAPDRRTLIARRKTRPGHIVVRTSVACLSWGLPYAPDFEARSTTTR